MDRWIDALPRDDIKAILKELLEGKGQQAERKMKIRFASWQRNLQADKPVVPRRTVGVLRRNAEKARQNRMEKEKREQKRQALKLRKMREADLKSLSRDFPKAWKSVRKSVERGSGPGYDEACRALVGISESYGLYGNKIQFQKELKEFLAGCMRCKALIQRLVTAGLWKDQ